MAILRGGKRILGQDIRIGIPRDRSLDNVEADPRLKRRPGGNRDTTINRFIAAVNEGEGLARNTRYLVRFFPPQPEKTGRVPLGDFDQPERTPDQELSSANLIQNVGMMCNKVTLPSRDIATKPAITYGPKREMPYAYNFPGQVECSFYGDKFLRQRMFFENWQKKIYNDLTHDMKYYDEYIGYMDILQLGQFADAGDRDRVTYAVRLYEVYPEVVGSIDYDYGGEYVNLPITMRFRNWRNLGLDEIGNFTVGKAFGDLPTIKASKDFGIFGGILNRLPPEIRRAGRDVLQSIKRSAPIGRITGGRVFPPFI